MFESTSRSVWFGTALLLGLAQAHADVVTDWNARAATIATQAQIGPFFGQRLMATVQVAVFEAVNATTTTPNTTPGAAPGRLGLAATPGASVDAAVAAANRVVLSKLAPTQQGAIEAAYHSALASIGDGKSRDDGVSLGERAAAGILALVLADGADAPQAWRPPTVAGVYTTTALPVVTHWGKRRPWLLTSPDQFRPGAPPALGSPTWARDYNEIKAVGGARSERRTPEQTAIAKFWEGTAPTMYHAVVRSVALQPGRDPLRNARLLAAAAQGVDDALIAVVDAKYHYNFWRPVTAIRNGDLDGNDATERDAAWTPFIDTPMHPEYPCAHCILAATVGAVLQAELGGAPMPLLSTTSPSAPGVTRSWAQAGDFVQEVSEARILDGVHFRASTEAGSRMGQEVGTWVAAKFFPKF